MNVYLWRPTGILLIMVINALLSGCAPKPVLYFKSAPVKNTSVEIRGELYWPGGQGPFPAIILLHGCGGVDQHYRDWALRIAGWGYVSFLVDSFTDRGAVNICSQTRKVNKTARALDIFGAARYLQQLPTVDGKLIGIMGFSHGGGAILSAVQENAPYVAKMNAFPFQAAVAFYPWCDITTDQNLSVPTLILTGERDDWTPADQCVLLERMIGTRDLLETMVFEGAYHAFDRPKHNRTYLGHRLEYDPSAAKQANIRSKAFFDYHLKEKK